MRISDAERCASDEHLMRILVTRVGVLAGMCKVRVCFCVRLEGKRNGRGFIIFL